MNVAYAIQKNSGDLPVFFSKIPFLKGCCTTLFYTLSNFVFYYCLKRFTILQGFKINSILKKDCFVKPRRFLDLVSFYLCVFWYY